MQRELVVRELQKRILAMQGLNKIPQHRHTIDLGPINQAFPNSMFPLGAVHEFISPGAEESAATSGFITCLLSEIAKRKQFSLWISSRRRIFPPALKLLGVDPDYIIFIDLSDDKDVLWATEEALRCGVLSAVIAEVKELNFARSRRLQLAIEQSEVTAFIHRIQPRSENTTACAARWKITPLPGVVEAGMPGVGFPKWNVELIKVRNGKPGSWQLAKTPHGFQHFSGTSTDTGTESETANYA